MSKDNIVWTGARMAILFVVCVFVALVSDFETAGAGVTAAITASVLIAPLLWWNQRIESGKKADGSAYTFLSILAAVTTLLAMVSLWAYDGGERGNWLDFWPESILSQVAAFVLMFLPIISVGLVVMYARRVIQEKKVR